ncbi:hypothetical protein [Streptomyces goshikiensis]|uniref:hypothetical protein n=1 Tax=Streptomyces goshikiensis TaxID=1942 RepID=UPI0033AFF9D3
MTVQNAAQAGLPTGVFAEQWTAGAVSQPRPVVVFVAGHLADRVLVVRRDGEVL